MAQPSPATSPSESDVNPFFCKCCPPQPDPWREPNASDDLIALHPERVAFVKQQQQHFVARLRIASLRPSAIYGPGLLSNTLPHQTKFFCLHQPLPPLPIPEAHKYHRFTLVDLLEHDTTSQREQTSNDSGFFSSLSASAAGSRSGSSSLVSPEKNAKSTAAMIASFLLSAAPAAALGPHSFRKVAMQQLPPRAEPIIATTGGAGGLLRTFSGQQLRQHHQGSGASVVGAASAVSSRMGRGRPASYVSTASQRQLLQQRQLSQHQLQQQQLQQQQMQQHQQLQQQQMHPQQQQQPYFPLQPNMQLPHQGSWGAQEASPTVPSSGYYFALDSRAYIFRGKKQFARHSWTFVGARMNGRAEDGGPSTEVVLGCSTSVPEQVIVVYRVHVARGRTPGVFERQLFSHGLEHAGGSLETTIRESVVRVIRVALNSLFALPSAPRAKQYVPAARENSARPSSDSAPVLCVLLSRFINRGVISSQEGSRWPTALFGEICSCDWRRQGRGLALTAMALAEFALAQQVAPKCLPSTMCDEVGEEALLAISPRLVGEQQAQGETPIRVQHPLEERQSPQRLEKQGFQDHADVALLPVRVASIFEEFTHRSSLPDITHRSSLPDTPSTDHEQQQEEEEDEEEEDEDELATRWECRVVTPCVALSVDLFSAEGCGLVLCSHPFSLFGSCCAVELPTPFFLHRKKAPGSPIASEASFPPLASLKSKKLMDPMHLEISGDAEEEEAEKSTADTSVRPLSIFVGTWNTEYQEFATEYISSLEAQLLARDPSSGKPATTSVEWTEACDALDSAVSCVSSVVTNGLEAELDSGESESEASTHGGSAPPNVQRMTTLNLSKPGPNQQPLRDWLTPGYDIYVITLQEVTNDNIFDTISLYLEVEHGEKYLRVNMGEGKISGLGKGAWTKMKATSMINGSKGAVTLVLRILKQTVCFVGCHMPASSVKARACVGLLACIRKNMMQDRCRARQHIRKKLANVYSNNPEVDFARVFHHVIWAGDFNFRLQTSLDVCLPLLQEGDIESLLQYDECREDMGQDMNLHQMREAPVEFLPTYKKADGRPPLDTSDPGWVLKEYQIRMKKGVLGQKKSSERPPSWCDRVFFWSMPAITANLQPAPNAYFAASPKETSVLMASDHAPVGRGSSSSSSSGSSSAPLRL
ncbi:hypothetical protein ACSSS7_006745 [Eimeria intestinalis]